MCRFLSEILKNITSHFNILIYPKKAVSFSFHFFLFPTVVTLATTIFSLTKRDIFDHFIAFERHQRPNSFLFSSFLTPEVRVIFIYLFPRLINYIYVFHHNRGLDGIVKKRTKN